jgi:AcrR family transcriptional regulator
MTNQTDLAFHRQRRAQVTRRELLLSAREIFARDGFENARLEDIASNIGKTRGALYDNFKNKEDVFYAIFEENIERDKAELAALLSGTRTIGRRVQALVSYLIRVSRDRERILLNMEFKLYAIRHPRRRQRFANLHNELCLQVSVPEFNQLLRQLGRETPRARRIHVLALSGILDGLVISHLFDPKALDNRELTRYLEFCMSDVLLEKPGVLETTKKAAKDAEVIPHNIQNVYRSMPRPRRIS